MKKSIAAVAVVAALALAACGSDSDGDADLADGQTALRIGYFPVVDAATAPRAIDAGVFEENGLSVTAVQTTGGAQAVPSLMSGEFDIAFSNYPSIILAASEGLPLQLVAGNNVGDADHSVMVPADSDITRPAELEGRNLAVSHLQNIGVLGISTVVAEDGGDPAAVQFVELPFPEMQAALDRGDVDAMWVVEPFMARGLDAGHEVLFNLFTGSMEASPVSGWVTTEEFAQENPEVLEAFRASIGEAGSQLQSDEDALVQTVTGFTDVDADTIRQINLPTWSSEIDEDALQALADRMVTFEFISEEFDISTILPGN